MSAAAEWAETVRRYGERNGLTYEPVGGINPKDGPVALCVGGSNRLTGAWRRPGVLGRVLRCRRARGRAACSTRRCCPAAILAKAHMPDLAKVVPAFNVESIEGAAEEVIAAARAQGRVRVDRLQQALPRHRPQRVRPGGAARAVQPRLPRLGDDDRQRDRLRHQRPPALVPLAAAGAHRGGAEERRSTNAGQLFRAAAAEMEEHGHPHLPARAPGTPGWSRSRRSSGSAAGSAGRAPSGPASASCRSAPTCASSPAAGQLALLGSSKPPTAFAGPAPSRRRSRTRSPRTWKFSCQVKSGAWRWAVRQARPSVSGSPAAARLDRDPARSRSTQRTGSGPRAGSRRGHPGEHRGRWRSPELLDALVPRRGPALRGGVRLARLLAVAGANLLQVRVVDRRLASVVAVRARRRPAPAAP